MRETKPGWQTTEFWLVLLGNILINVGAVDVGGAKYRGLFAILSVVGYALARGLAKNGIPDGMGGPEQPVGDEGDTGEDVPMESTHLVVNSTNVQASEGFFDGGSGGVYDSASSIGPEPEGVPKPQDQRID